MADADISINDSGSTARKVDTRTVGAGTDEHRQVVVIGDDSSTRVSSVVDETGSSAVDALAVGGGTPHDSVDSGNPLKIGGRASQGPVPVVADDRVNAWYGLQGQAIVGGDWLSSEGDGLANSAQVGLSTSEGAGGQIFAVGPRVYNGTTWDRARNVTGALASSGEDFSPAAGIGPGYARRVAGTHGATGAGTAINTQGASYVSIRFTGTFVATVTFEGSFDGTNYVTISAYRYDTGAWATTNATSSTTWLIPVRGLRLVRTNCTAFTSGTVTYNSTAQTADDVFPIVDGGIAHDAADGGNPIKVGGWAGTISSGPTAVANGDRVNAWFTGQGALMSALVTGGTSTLTDSESNVQSNAPTPGGLNNIALAVRGLIFDGTNWVRPRSLTAFDTAAASPSRVGMAATITPDQRFTSVSLATAANSTQTWDVNGVSDAIVHCGTGTTGTFIFEITADGSNWLNVTGKDVATDLVIGGVNITPTANKVYRILTAGYRTLRVRTVTTLGTTVAFSATLSAPPAALAIIDTGPAPHNMGYAIQSVSANYTTTQTSTNVVAGTAGQRIYVTSLIIGTGGTTAGLISLYWGTSTFSRGTSPTLFEAEYAPSATARPGSTISFPAAPGAQSATGDNLRITTSAGITCYVTVHYYKA